MNPRTPDREAAEKAGRFERRRAALARAMRPDVFTLRRIIRGDGPKK